MAMPSVRPSKIKTFKFNSEEDAETMYLMLKSTTKWQSVSMEWKTEGHWEVIAIEKTKVPICKPIA